MYEELERKAAEVDETNADLRSRSNWNIGISLMFICVAALLGGYALTIELLGRISVSLIIGIVLLICAFLYCAWQTMLEARKLRAEIKDN